METVVSWFLNDYGVLDESQLISAWFIFSILVCILFLCIFRNLINSNNNICFLCIWTVGTIFIFENLPTPLDIAEKYGTEQQRERLFECLRKEYGLKKIRFINSLSTEPSKPTIGNALISCEKAREKR